MFTRNAEVGTLTCHVDTAEVEHDDRCQDNEGWTGHLLATLVSSTRMFNITRST